MYTLEELKPKIIEWANERDLIHPKNADKQRLKLIEECGELAKSILENNIEKQKDGIGDIFVVLTILAEQENIDLNLLWGNEYDDYKNYSYFDILKNILANGDLEYDNYFWLYAIAHKLNHDLTECANLAYNEIKNRKGVTINGTFIKDSTPSDYIIDKI